MVREQVYLWLLGAVGVTGIGGCGGITMPGPEGNVRGTGGTTSEGGIHVGTPDSRWIDTGMSSDCTYVARGLAFETGPTPAETVQLPMSC